MIVPIYVTEPLTQSQRSVALKRGEKANFTLPISTSNVLAISQFSPTFERCWLEWAFTNPGEITQSREKQMEIDLRQHLAYLNLKEKKNNWILRTKNELKLSGGSFPSCPRTGIVPSTTSWIVCLDKLPPHSFSVVQRMLKNTRRQFSKDCKRSCPVVYVLNYSTVFKVSIDRISSYLFFQASKDNTWTPYNCNILR